MLRYAMDYHVVPTLQPVDDTATAATAFVDVKDHLWLEFLVPLGAVTGDTVTMTVEECTANATSGGATEVAVPFVYRLSSALGTDSMGAATTSSSSGIAISASDDNMVYVLSIDPRRLDENYNFVRVTFAQGSSTSDFAAAVIALLYPRYPQATPLSAS